HTLGLCRKHKHDPNPYPSGILHQGYPSTLFQRYSPTFILKRTDITLFTNNSSSFTRLSHDYYTNHELRHCEIQQSCNGLLLWKSTSAANALLQRCRFYVSNQTTGRYVAIDQFGHKSHEKFSKPFLAFEPWKSPHYKIIFFFKVDEDGNKLTTKMKMSVYSSATGSWTKLDLLPSFPNNIDYSCDGVYCNGAIHWYALGENSVHFDIDRLCLKTLPTSPSHQLEVVHFGGCGRNLHLTVGKRHESSRYNIWELKEDYSGWIARYHVDLSSIDLHGFLFEFKCVVRQPPKEDEDEESMLAILIVNLQKFVAYNLKDHSSRVFYEEPAPCPPNFHHQYFETLVGVRPGYNNNQTKISLGQQLKLDVLFL
ncbi:hypothetical protein PIB30_103242, partial [Stylosanthes scabra]|nr:hypothetical protein [Stylosanthes scabra]